MQLLSWPSLWFGLSLPLIVLMYLLKKTYVDTEISSSLLWRKALREQEANRPWQKLRRQLLLLLQLLIAALLVFALMGPYTYGTAASRAPAAAVIDISASMTGRAAGGDALADARRAFREWLDAQPAGKPVTLIAAGRDPAVLLAGATDRRALTAAVDALRPDYGRSDGPAALTAAKAALRGEPGGEVVLFTDGRWPGGLPPITELGVPVNVVRTGGEGVNAAIAAFGVRAGGADEAGSGGAPAADGAGPSGASEAGMRYAAVVTLVNYADRPLSGTLAIAAADADEPLVREPFALEAGQQRSYPAENLPPAAYYRASIEVPDSYDADNAAYAFPASAGERSALIVGEGNLFLDKALQLAGVRTVLADPAAFEPDEETMRRIDWVVLDGVDEERLQTAGWSKLLADKPVWRIWSAERPPGEAQAIVPNGTGAEVREHPVTQYITFADVHIARLVETTAGRAGEPVLLYGGVPAIFAGTADGKPQLVFAFDLRDSDLPLRPEFPVLAAQAADWMSGGLSPHLGKATAGEQLEIRLHAEAASAHWEPIETAERTEAEQPREPLPADAAAGGELSALQTAPPAPGLYRFVETGAGGERLAARMLAVAPDPAEGVWTNGEQPAAGASAAGPSSDATVDGPADESAIDGSGAETGGAREERTMRPWTPWIAALLLLLLMFEWGVYRRGTAG